MNVLTVFAVLCFVAPITNGRRLTIDWAKMPGVKRNEIVRLANLALDEYPLHGIWSLNSTYTSGDYARICNKIKDQLDAKYGGRWICIGGLNEHFGDDIDYFDTERNKNYSQYFRFILDTFRFIVVLPATHDAVANNCTTDKSLELKQRIQELEVERDFLSSERDDLMRKAQEQLKQLQDVTEERDELSLERNQLRGTVDQRETQLQKLQRDHEASLQLYESNTAALENLIVQQNAAKPPCEPQVPGDRFQSSRTPKRLRTRIIRQRNEANTR